MVNITPEEVMAQRRAQEARDRLTDFDKAIIGGATRIEIPFCDVVNMRRIADLLRGYANTLDVYSRRTDLPARSILLHLKMEAKVINNRIRQMTGKRWTNSN
ncbi:MAG: hypothetical protein QJR04_25170 [Burkholderia multivorans]|nr:hypothetical protein [Burkholderia multivorans]